MEEKPRVLVVEDDPSWQDIYRERLGDAGCEIQVVESLAAAQDALNRYFFHVAVIDIRLKDGNQANRDGMRVLHRIWQLDEGTLAVVGSGYVEVDMYSEFRKYGVFGLTEKSRRTADEALVAYKGTSFIRGSFIKSEEVDEIVSKVRKASEDAQREIVRWRWLASPFGLIKGLSAKEIQQRLRVGQMIELHPFLADLCHPLYPWLRSKQDAVEITDGDEVLAIEARCWSRALGKPVSIVFGRRDWAKSTKNLTLSNTVGGGGAIEDELAHDFTAHFDGVLYTLRDVNFQTNFEMPAPKRTCKSSLSLD